MKNKIASWLLSSTLTAACFAAPVFGADEPTKPDRPNRPERPERPDRPQRPGAGQPGGQIIPLEDRFKAALGELNLSDDQKTKSDAIIIEVTKKRAELRTANQANPTGEKMVALRDESMAKFKTILNEEQYKKLEEAMNRQPQAGLPGQPGGGRNILGMFQNIQETLGQLQLSDEQKTKVAALMAETRTKMQELRTGLQNGGVDPAMREKVMTLVQGLQTDLQKILTPEQAEKLKAAMPNLRGGPNGDRPQRPARPDGQKPAPDKSN